MNEYFLIPGRIGWIDAYLLKDLDKYENIIRIGGKELTYKYMSEEELLEECTITAEGNLRISNPRDMVFFGDVNEKKTKVSDSIYIAGKKESQETKKLLTQWYDEMQTMTFQEIVNYFYNMFKKQASDYKHITIKEPSLKLVELLNQHKIYSPNRKFTLHESSKIFYNAWKMIYENWHEELEQIIKIKKEDEFEKEEVTPEKNKTFNGNEIINNIKERKKSFLRGIIDYLKEKNKKIDYEVMERKIKISELNHKYLSQMKKSLESQFSNSSILLELT